MTKKPLRILMVEDSEDDAMLLLRVLRKAGHEVETRTSYHQERDAGSVGTRTVDLILSDFYLPGFNGLAALEIYKEQELDIPFIVVSGAIGEETAVELMRAGAHDYLMKDKLARLPVAVERELREAEIRRQRKEAGIRLLESEATARALLNAPNDFAMLMAIDGTILGLNQTASRHLKSSSDGHVGKSAYDYLPPEVMQSRRERFEKVLQTGKPITFEDQSRGYTFENHIYPVFDENGLIVRLAIYAYDITEQKLAQEALRESEERFRSLIQNSSDLIVVLNGNNRIQYVSPSVSSVLGYSVDWIIEKGIVELVHPDDLKILFDLLISIHRTPGQTKRGEIRILNHSGEWLYLEIILNNLLDMPSVHGVVINARDVSQRKKDEERILQAYEKTLEGWSRALELREQETAGHSQRVVDLTVRLAAEMGMDSDQLVHVRRGALLHDIGKMGIPDNILLKPGSLTADEWVVMRQHPLYAYEFLAGIPYLIPALDIPHYHHEKWDGTGYPAGLKGEAIPLSARIFHIIDCWDALLSNRPYRPAWPESEVRAYLLRESGKSFDPNLVGKFMEIIGD